MLGKFSTLDRFLDLGAPIPSLLPRPPRSPWGAQLVLQQASPPFRGQLGKTRKTGGFLVPWYQYQGFGFGFRGLFCEEMNPRAQRKTPEKSRKTKSRGGGGENRPQRETRPYSTTRLDKPIFSQAIRPPRDLAGGPGGGVTPV